MDYYHDLITQKSFNELKHLKKVVDFTLIGGWAVYFYAKTLKSKDIDIIVDYDQLPAIAKHYQISKNDRLHKYEARRDEVQIDVYLPHYSNLGIPVEQLILHSRNVEGFTILEVNYLFALKIYTLSQRAPSIKGRKDFLDLLSLVLSKSISLSVIQSLVTNFNLESAWKSFLSLLADTSQVPELNLNPHQLSRLKQTLS